MTRPALRRALPAALALAALAPSCAPYRLGSPLSPELRAVEVSVRNRSDEPGLDRALPAALRREVLRDGSLRVAPHETAGSRLEVTALETTVRAISHVRNDPLVPDEYRVTVRARFRFVRASDGAVVAQGVETGEAAFQGADNFASDKLRNLPAVCDDLSRRILRKCAFAFEDAPPAP